MTSPAMLAIENVAAGYGGVLALQDVSITARPGTITAVLGANGAGKTTLLATISGFVRPRQGRIRLDGTDLARRRPEEIVRAGVAHVPEGQAVITELTVEENLRVGALRQAGRADRSRALADAYERFPMLAKAKNRSAGTLSGGERQILVIARALMTRPRALLLDEPSLGLAPKIVTQVMDLILRLRDETGLTVVLVEQNARSALAIADHGVVLNVGRVVATESAARLAADEALRKHYLGF
jgi:branched-chain amino acid transport system ATP-binding protein